MTTIKWRVYRKNSRAPRDFLGKVDATSAEEAVAKILAQPGNAGIRYALEAIPSHAKPTVRGK